MVGHIEIPMISMPGSGPGGSREFEGGDGAASLEMTYLITDRKGLED